MFNVFKRIFRPKIRRTRAPVPVVPMNVKTRSFVNMPHVFLVHNLTTGDQHIAATAIPEQAMLRVKRLTVGLESEDSFSAVDITLAIRALKHDRDTLKNLMRHIITD